VIFVGTEAGGMTTHIWQVPRPGTRVVQIDIHPETLGRHYRLEAAVLGDAKVSLARLTEMVEGDTPGRSEWLARVKLHCDSWRSEYAPMLGSEAVPIRPERICAELTEAVPDDGIVVVDTGHGGMWMGGMYDLTSPGQSYIRSAGHLGWAFPASLGAKCAAPDRPVVCFTGDGGLWYHIGEIETAVRWNINTVTVVNNNGSGNQSKRGFDRAYGGTQTEKARELWTYSDVDFAQIAIDMGAEGIRVEKPSEIGPAIHKALSLDRPVVVDVVTDIEAIAPGPVTPDA
jgi:acetolactate synthase I/II/III large subunit